MQMWKLRIPPAPVPRTLALALAFGAAAHGADIQRDELKTGVSLDLGRIQQGVLDGNPVEGQFISNTGVYMMQSLTIDQRLRLTVGIGGLFWYSLPEQFMPHRRYTKFGPGVGQAQMALSLGSLDNPWGLFQFGLIPYKYNPDAVNLGEYLLRSQAYPNVLVTGGWSIFNSANILMQGMGLQARTGPLTHSFLLMVEQGLGPQHDLTPAYLADLDAGRFFHAGAGVAFASLIPINPRITTPDGPGHPGDLTTQALGRFEADTVVTDTADRTYSNFTYQAVKLMARASFSPLAAVESGWLKPDDFRLYAEAAVLGWKNYPYYYEDRMARIPVMMGVRLPTFRLLDMLSVEFEYRKAEFLNSSRVSYGESALPLPYIKSVNSTESYSDLLTRYKAQRDSLMDGVGIHWSVNFKRTVIPGMALLGQVASDHTRGFEFHGFPLSEPTTATWKDWYFIFRVELGI